MNSVTLARNSSWTCGDFHRGPISNAYREALGGDIDSNFAPDDWITRRSQLPLIHQPGAKMSYGRATDLLGLLIARIEGEPLGAVLKQRIFDPLGMKDTSFLVSPDKRDRRAAAYGFNDKGRLTKRTTWSGVVVAERPEDMTYESGGAGPWSTVDDYLCFARLFLGDGSVDGVRLLRPEMLALMMTNQLTEAQRASSGWVGWKPFAAGRGFGLGVSVVLETDANDLMPRGGVETVSWPGAFGGWWQADPNDGSVLIFLAHNMVDLAQMARVSGLVSGPRLMPLKNRQPIHKPDFCFSLKLVADGGTHQLGELWLQSITVVGSALLRSVDRATYPVNKSGSGELWPDDEQTGS